VAATDWAVSVDGVVGLCLWVVCGVSGARLTTLLEGSSSLDLEDLVLMIGCCWAAVVFVLLLLVLIDLDDEEASLVEGNFLECENFDLIWCVCVCVT